MLDSAASYDIPEHAQASNLDELLGWIEKLCKPSRRAGGFPAAPIFRGHASPCWSLQSSLERIGIERCGLEAYIRAASVALRSCGRTPDLQAADEQAEFRALSVLKEDLIHPFMSLPLLESLVWLRHIGVPSPLLDWTYDPLVACSFALGEASQPKGEGFTIWCCVSASIPILSEGSPMICFPGPHVEETSGRHIAQRATFTIAVEDGNPDGDLQKNRHPTLIQHSLGALPGHTLHRIDCKFGRQDLGRYVSHRGITHSRLMAPTGSTAAGELAEQASEVDGKVLDSLRRNPGLFVPPSSPPQGSVDQG